MARVLLLAAGGLARETASSILATGDHHVVGMLDDSASMWGSEISGVAVLGGIELAAQRSELLLVCAGPGRARARIVRRLAALGVGLGRYATHVSGTASIGSNASVWPGSIILPGCVLTCDVSVGKHAVLMPRVVLTHDNAVGDYATLAAGVALGGNTVIGSTAYVGMNASVRQGLTVGEGATLGMGAVLLVDQPANSVWAGNPARALGGHDHTKITASPRLKEAH
ncbi:acetyltransferase [Paeniglutamicibacter sp. NPDC012692]|uniref:acetyltransferase n=1 Tax=Paeniglutamicibacter sp. NPDC012692 TaxID=3364388 RepID=UPI0036771248